MISQFQQYVLERMQQATLSNHYEGESAPYRPSFGMSSGFIHTPGTSTTVPYKTIAALLKISLIEETHRVSSDARQGDNTWQSSTIYYRLTDKADQYLMEKSQRVPVATSGVKHMDEITTFDISQ